MTDKGFRRLVLGLLVLNTFLVCALAGAGLFYVTRTPSAPVGRLPLAGEDLPAANRADFQKALSDARKAERPQVLAGQQARIEAAALMGQETLDRDRLAAALARAREAEFAVRAATEARAIDFVAALSLEERQRLAQGLIRREAPRPPAR
ncbi:hypothetical protein BJF93_22670 [Xaviernesmea oryzae]|uniref:Periplasmic heavy metal sensor n=1 Tax=Xaviernesmea oryzae TaxID=464029 RepID=A0A1Q9B394_9HYPH|nr:periplasmic heavy metal sensor [Xaviernesmea oryzae]OLP62464.1 hypothetical protein BJF93_22670 [Xaviernesmea oryzae]SEM17313.1 Uncharacterized membrane protein [Xaviernesmea oryzae]